MPNNVCLPGLPQALERQVLSQVQDELSERATALCVHRGQVALPPLSVALDKIKARAAAALLAIHSKRSAMPRLAAVESPQQQLVGAAAAGAGAAACQPHSSAPIGGASAGNQLCSVVDALRPGFEQLAATLQCAMHQQVPSLPGMPEQQPGPGIGSLLNLASSSGRTSHLGWQPLTPPYARPRFTQLPLPSAPVPLPPLAEPTLLQMLTRAAPGPGLCPQQQGLQPRAASAVLVGDGMLAPGWQPGQVMQQQQQQLQQQQQQQVQQQQQQQHLVACPSAGALSARHTSPPSGCGAAPLLQLQQQRALPVIPLQLFSTPAAGGAAHLAQEEQGMAAAGRQVAQPGAESFLTVLPQGVVSQHAVALSQEQQQQQLGDQWAGVLPQAQEAAVWQGAQTGNHPEGAAGASQGNLAVSGAEAAARQSTRSEALRMATRSALRWV